VMSYIFLILYLKCNASGTVDRKERDIPGCW